MQRARRGPLEQNPKINPDVENIDAVAGSDKPSHDVLAAKGVG